MMILINYKLLSILLGDFLGFYERLWGWDKFYTNLDKTLECKFDSIRKEVYKNLTQPLFIEIDKLIDILTNVYYFSKVFLFHLDWD
jgi:hypothetical protein